MNAGGHEQLGLDDVASLLLGELSDSLRQRPADAAPPVARRDPELDRHRVGVLVERQAELGPTDHDSPFDGGDSDMAGAAPGMGEVAPGRLERLPPPGLSPVGVGHSDHLVPGGEFGVLGAHRPDLEHRASQSAEHDHRILVMEDRATAPGFSGVGAQWCGCSVALVFLSPVDGVTDDGVDDR